LHTALEPDDTSARSPFRFTAISDLDPVCNIDTITLDGLLGGEDLTEAWLFDYMFDMDFVMSAFAPGIRDTVAVKVVHGSWQADSEQRAHLERFAKRHANVEAICAWMPERFGTHHSKMMVLFTESSARVVVHTANMIPRDWANMTQGAWLSPPLPLLDPATATATAQDHRPAAIGTGARFKADLLRYLAHYDAAQPQRTTPRTAPLVARLRGHCFAAVRAAFLASAPGAERPAAAADAPHTLFGWPGLRQILRALPPPSGGGGAGGGGEDPPREDLVVQVSSIATVHEAWMANFHRVLATAGAGGGGGSGGEPARPRLRLVFPTAGEIRASLDGYASGGSIHLKGATATQQKQLQRLRPHLCRWGGGDADDKDARTDEASGRGNAMRGLAAPHVKTYARLATAKGGGGGAEATRARWALLTSANLSTQAWGALPDAREGRVRVCSYEVGVVVWPELFAGAGDGGRAEMVPVFGRDSLEAGGPGLVPLRLPYGLPLEGYKGADRPWCRNVRHDEPDWWGRRWVPEE
jgi:tyrosyl-DNA phosphodiesterase-1